MATASLLLAGCAGSDSDDKCGGGKCDAWDDQNAPELFGLTSLSLEELQQPEALIGYLAEKPWSDTYWPLNEKGMSVRWIGGGEFDSFEEQRDDANAALAGVNSYAATWELSPAEKYDILVGDSSYGMTKEGWDTYAQYEDYEFDWGWMGHCHGWAPAAYLTSSPKAGVIANKGGKQILFTEGDIRGLLTKAYATNRTSGGTFFMGGRCNARTILKDDNGRIVDGTLFDAKADAPKEADLDTASHIYIDRNFWDRYYILTYSDEPGSNDIKVLQATANAEEPNGAFIVNVFGSIQDYQDQKVEKEMVFNYTKTCRDTNAGSFHIALVQYLSDVNAPEDKRGFVLDVTREDQVWNQPVYGFESEVTAVENVADIDDPLAEFRAEGTVQLARIKTKVSYGVENGPYVDYNDSNGFRLSSKNYSYSLEIDADGYVIGGEWDNANENNYYGSSAPDFLWAAQGELQDSATIKASEIKKIHACSLDADNARSETLPDGQEIQVVDCDL